MEEALKITKPSFLARYYNFTYFSILKGNLIFGRNIKSHKITGKNAKHQFKN